MKKIKYIIISLVLVSTSLFTYSCKDEFADTNTDQSAIVEGNPSFIFAESIIKFEPQGYLYWFYNAPGIYQWVQTGVSTGGVTSAIIGGATPQNFGSIDVLKYANDLKYIRSNKMDAKEGVRYAQYSAAIDILSIYMGIFDTDFVGDISYTEAANVLHGGTLTPKYDRVKDLYDLWLGNLDEDMKVLTTATNQVFQSSQDPVYAGQALNWAKLANSLKLKIAARLINQNRSKALKIAQEVATSSIGVISNESEDFLFNKAISSTTSNDYAYHFGNDVLSAVGGSKSMIDFLVKNRDPRVRFIFQKNSWNSKIVQLFFDAKRQKDVPKYIMDNVNYTVDSNGIYKFQSWKGAGEPWVRYYGLPLAYNAAQQAGLYGDWFNYTEQCKYNENFTYIPYSMFQEEMIRGRVGFTYPTTPSDPAIKDTEDMPWWGMYMTSAEVNLYLAEFALLGATLPETASAYFNKAIEASVKEYDRLASKNKIPYYGTTYNYDPNEKSIELASGEIATMMSNADYKLTGDKASDLEKVYLQQIIHFSLQPVDQYTTARRSGIPKIGSTIYPRVVYTQIPTTSIPRRMSLSQPLSSDLMYDILMNSYKEQGLSVGPGTILNSERLWQDQGAPQWGEGPK